MNTFRCVSLSTPVSVFHKNNLHYLDFSLPTQALLSVLQAFLAFSNSLLSSTLNYKILILLYCLRLCLPANFLLCWIGNCKQRVGLNSFAEIVVICSLSLFYHWKIFIQSEHLQLRLVSTLHLSRRIYRTSVDPALKLAAVFSHLLYNLYIAAYPFFLSNIY